MTFNLVTIIITITCLVSIGGFYDKTIMARLINSPYDVKRFNQWYRLLSSGFLHADFIHLFFNMYVLYNFGIYVLNDYKELFDIKGVFYFALLYLGAILISDLPTYKKEQDNPSYKSLGASGGVSAVLFAFIFLHPTIMITMMFVPIPLPGVVWGVAYLFYSWYMERRGGGNINHSAHVTGAIFGIIYTVILRPTLVVDFIEQIKELL